MPSPLWMGGVLPAIADPRRHRTVQQWSRKYGTVFGYRWELLMRLAGQAVHLWLPESVQIVRIRGGHLVC